MLHHLIPYLIRLIHWQAVTIHRIAIANNSRQNDTHLSLHLFRAFFSLALLVSTGRDLAGTFAVYFHLPEYFKLDYAFDETYFESEDYTPRLVIVVTLIGSFATLFDGRLFELLYFRPDRVVWLALYDLMVRNREQLKMRLWLKSNQSSQSSWLGLGGERLLKMIPSFQVFPKTQENSHSSPPLLYYPKLKEGDRLRCLFVLALFELTVATKVYRNLLNIVGHYLVVRGGYTAVQLHFLNVVLLSALLFDFVSSTARYLTALSIGLLCSVCDKEYREVNQNLEKIKNSLSKLYSLNTFELRRATTAYRTAHTRLTAFILRFNESTVSQVISYYIHYVIPLHALVSEFTIFKWQKSEISGVKTVNGRLRDSLIVDPLTYLDLWLLFLATTFLTARLNARISSSGPTLATILAKRSLLTSKRCAKKCARRFQCALWNRELLKLANYYELVWRSEKPLAFTAGRLNATMDWKYVFEVRVKVCISFLLIDQLL